MWQWREIGPKGGWVTAHLWRPLSRELPTWGVNPTLVPERVGNWSSTLRISSIVYLCSHASHLVLTETVRKHLFSIGGWGGGWIWMASRKKIQPPFIHIETIPSHPELVKKHQPPSSSYFEKILPMRHENNHPPLSGSEKIQSPLLRPKKNPHTQTFSSPASIKQALS